MEAVSTFFPFLLLPFFLFYLISLPYPTFPLPALPFPFPSLPVLLLPLEVGPINQLGFPQRGLWQNPGQNEFGAL